MVYKQLFRFLLPLVLTIIVQEFSGQVLNGGMTRMPRATETLAAYGLAWGLVTFLSISLSQARQLGLVLVHGQRSFNKVRLVVLLLGVILTGVLTSLALTPVGTWVIEDLHGVHEPLSTVVREALLALATVPILWGLVRFYSGVLIGVRRTDMASSATLAGIGASILVVFILLPAGFVQQKPIRLPVLVTYAGYLTELGVLLWGYRRYGGPALIEPGEELSFGYVIRFFWPLAFIMGSQGLSRPLINLFISRGPDGPEALAVLTVVYALGHLPYGWVNEVRNLAPAFRDLDNSLVYIRRFGLACGLLSFSVMLVLFWTPLRDTILETLIGVSPHLAGLSRVPLVIFTFFPLAVMVRAYFHGVGLLERRTLAMVPSAPSRIGAILIALLILPAPQIHGATRAIAALLCGFILETIVVGWGVHRNGGRQVDDRVAETSKLAKRSSVV